LAINFQNEILLENVSLTDAGNALPSFAFIRHPFSRFASGYHERMIVDWQYNKNNSYYHSIRELIVSKFRRDPTISDPYPTPSEFAQYFIEQENKNCTHRLDIKILTLEEVFLLV
jgi:hypothetical protein